MFPLGWPILRGYVSFREGISHATPKQEVAYFCDMLYNQYSPEKTFGESLNEVHHITHRIHGTGIFTYIYYNFMDPMASNRGHPDC